MNGMWLPLLTLAVAALALLSGSDGARFAKDNFDRDGPGDREDRRGSGGRRPLQGPRPGPSGGFDSHGHYYGPNGGSGHFDASHGGPGGHFDNRPHGGEDFDQYSQSCRNFTWFQTTTATNGTTCLTQLPTANNVTTPFYNNQTLLQPGNFTICVCCRESRKFSCDLVKGGSELRAVNVTTVQ